MDDRQKRRRNYNRKWVAAKRKSLNLALNEQDNDSDSGSSTCSMAWNGSDVNELNEGPSSVSHHDTSIVVDDVSPCPVSDPENDCIWEWDVDGCDIFSSCDSDMESETSLTEDLANWINKHQIKHSAADDLLKLLRSHGHASLPLSARTLLKSDRVVVSEEKSGMQYAYLGVENSIVKHFDKYPTEIKENTTRLSVALNIDGIPLFRSSNTVLWPTLCSILLQPVTVFPVAITCGRSKPDNLDFLRDTVADLADILQNGLQYQDKNIEVVLKSIVCDAPARAMVKGMKQYSGYFGCDKCNQKGLWLGRMTFQESEHFTRRTNQSFRDRANAEHHHTVSPFADLPIDMVKAFPVDYMHQACLGVMRRLILLWVRGKKETKLSARQVQEINTKLFALQPSIPKCFARKPRGFNEIDRWKATEYRQFLLHTGKIVLKRTLRQDMFAHFLSLSVAMCILVSPRLVQIHSQYAQSLLTYFVKQGRELYGPEFLVYNVHSLLHITDDAVEFGGLDRCGGFVFENYLHSMKKMVRSGKNPLAQVVKRIHEMDNMSVINNQTCQKYPMLMKRPNNTFILDDDSCCEVADETNEVDEDGNKKYFCRIYNKPEPDFMKPCDSRLIGVYKTSIENTHMQLISPSRLNRQAIMIKKPSGREAVFLTILHEL